MNINVSKRRSFRLSLFVSLSLSLQCIVLCIVCIVFLFPLLFTYIVIQTDVFETLHFSFRSCSLLHGSTFLSKESGIKSARSCGTVSLTLSLFVFLSFCLFVFLSFSLFVS